MINPILTCPIHSLPLSAVKHYELCHTESKETIFIVLNLYDGHLAAKYLQLFAYHNSPDNMGEFSLKYAATELIFSDFYVSEEIQRNSIECFNGCLEFLGILSACYVVMGLPHLNAKSCNYCLSSIEYAHVPALQFFCHM